MPKPDRLSAPKPGEVIRFFVPGKPVGYYTMGARPNWQRMTAYHDYKKRVQWTATTRRISLPLLATEKYPVYLETQMYVANRVHADPENIHKAVCDSLFYGAKGGDKHVGGKFHPARYSEREGVDVIIRRKR